MSSAATDADRRAEEEDRRDQLDADNDRLCAEIVRLESLVELGAKKLTDFMGRCCEAEATLRDCNAEIERLREALRPLASMAPHYPPVKTFGNRPISGEIHTVREHRGIPAASITVEDLHRAAALINELI